MSYSILNMGGDTRKQAMQGLRQVAEREEARERGNQQLKTAERNQTMGATASGAAIGTSIMPGVGTAVGAAAGFVLGELF